MLWWLVLPILPAIYFLYCQIQPKILCRGQKLRPAPDTFPLLGNAIKFLQPRHVLFDWFVKCQREHDGETLEISVPSLPPGVLVTDPTILEFVLKNQDSITKGSFFKERSWDLFGHGIINATGEMWKAQRKAGLKFFGGTNLETMVEEVLPEVYEKTRSYLRLSAKNKDVIDMQQIFLDFTTTVVGLMAYDMDIDASSPFSKAFDYASDHVGLRFQNPLYRLTELFTGSKFQAAIAEVKKFGKKIVANAKLRRSREAFESLITNEEPVFGSLIDSLLEAFRDPGVVADSALNFLSAGRDTTAQSFTWTLYSILRHPDILPTLHEEIRVISTNLNGSESTASKVQQPDLTTSILQPSNIPHMISTFYESLRLHPPVPFELKQCEAPVTLPDGTFLPESSIVLWCIHAINRSHKLYGLDADIFRPSRWLDSQGKFVSRTAYEFPVFNGGPRACLGKKMAELMGCWILIRLMNEFDFEEVGREEVVGGSGGTVWKERRSQNSLTLPMEGGLPCRVTVRPSGVRLGVEMEDVDEE